jgi:hypothetical protein
MASDQWLHAVTELTKLIATYGVYAILVIGLFYLLRWATRQLKEAPQDMKPFFEKVLMLVLVADFVLMGVATWMWYYVNYAYFRKAYIQGSIIVSATDTRLRAELVEDIAPESTNVDFYEKGSLTAGASKQWVLFPRAKFSNVVFTFQHRYAGQATHAASEEPTPNAPPAMLENHIISKKFSLDLEKMLYFN